jgi:hypothetical protein
MVRWTGRHGRAPAHRQSLRLPVTGSPRGRARTAWFGTAAAINAVMFAVLAAQELIADLAVEASLLAFCLAVAVRHDGLVRGVFVLGRWAPSYRLHQLTYHLGQFHRAMALAGTAWLALAIATEAVRDSAARAVGLAVLAILLMMAWTARDAVRQVHHNRFELIHRFGGWTVLGILTVLVLHQAATSAPPGSGPIDLLGQPAVVLLMVLLMLVAHPWLGVRHLPVEILTVTDDVVVIALPGRHCLGEFVRVSRRGLEWHSIAVATTGTEGPGQYCLVIRRAGDWTGQLGRDAAHGCAPHELLVRRIRGYGFMYHAQTCHRVLFVATGAGIGPVLPYLIGPPAVGFQCLWVGRNHRRMMGEKLVDQVLTGGHVTLLDTTLARPDIGASVMALAPGFDAVFVVSNEKVRDQVAGACQQLGVP